MGRWKLLAGETAHRILSDVWAKSADLDGWYVGRYVLMPDHVHFFSAPAPDAKPREVWHKMWKSVTARRLAGELKLAPPIWQHDTFDHILRSTDS
jgi:REP element-mobilizing transposase RayT